MAKESPTAHVKRWGSSVGLSSDDALDQSDRRLTLFPQLGVADVVSHVVAEDGNPERAGDCGREDGGACPDQHGPTLLRVLRQYRSNGAPPPWLVVLDLFLSNLLGYGSLGVSTGLWRGVSHIEFSSLSCPGRCTPNCVQYSTHSATMPNQRITRLGQSGQKERAPVARGPTFQQFQRL